MPINSELYAAGKSRGEYSELIDEHTLYGHSELSTPNYRHFIFDNGRVKNFLLAVATNTCSHIYRCAWRENTCALRYCK